VLRDHPFRAVIQAAGLLVSDLVILGTHGKSGMNAFCTSNQMFWS
jgi:hypothetical protein